MIAKENQIDRMHYLMNYGKSDSSNNLNSKVSPIVEHSKKAADGRTYGILKEGNKYYIKVAPIKNDGVNILAEDYDYIGGFMNKKQYEYSGYSAAYKNFDLKMQQINEAHEKTKVQLTEPTPSAEWQINETKEMRAEIERFKQINENVGRIMEGKESFTTAHTVPEAPASHPSKKKVQDPFVDTAVAKGDKDFKETNDNPASAAGPFDKTVKSVEKQMASDKKPSANTDATYTEPAKYVPNNAITTQNPSGGKAKMVKEGHRRFKLTEAQVLAWNRENPDYMNTEKGTKIGSTEPYEFVITLSDITKDKPNDTHTSKGKSSGPYTESVNESVYDVAGMPDVPFPEDMDDEEDVDDLIAKFEAEQGLDKYADDLKGEDAKDIALQDYETDRQAELRKNRQRTRESRRHNGKGINEDRLNVFGKHPAYQKVPFSTPTHVSRPPRWAREWDDETVKGDTPFGTRKGKPSPYDEIVDLLVDRVMRESRRKNFRKKAH